MARLAAAGTPASEAPESSAGPAGGRGSSRNADLAAKCVRLEKELREAKKESKRLDAAAKRSERKIQDSERENRRLERDMSCLKDENKTLKAELAAAQAASADAAGPSGRKRRRTEKSTEKVELPIGVWKKIAEKLHKNDVFSFALTCKQLREAQQAAGRKLETKTQWKDDDDNSFCVDNDFTRSWCWCHTRTFNINETRPKCFKAVNVVAASKGYLDVLKHWENAPEDKKKLLWDEYTCRVAAHGGRLDVLKYLRSQGCPWNRWTCAYAAEGGRLEVLKWLRSQGCPWDESTCSYAAYGGQLHVLKWARAAGCPWSEYTCSNAAQKGHLDTLKWLRSQNPPCPWSKSSCLYWAQCNNHSRVVDWINAQP